MSKRKKFYDNLMAEAQCRSRNILSWEISLVMYEALLMEMMELMVALERKNQQEW